MPVWASALGLYRDELARADSPDKRLAELIVLLIVLKKRQFGDETRRLVWVGESYPRLRLPTMSDGESLLCRPAAMA